MTGREYLTITEASAVLEVPLRTLRYRLLHGFVHGERIHARLWLIPRAEVERWRGRGDLPRGRRPRGRGRALPYAR